MSAWFDYGAEDFLLFTPETYWRLFELHNKALWPVQPVVMALLVVLSIAAARGWRRAGLAVGIAFAASWGFVAHGFLATRYAPINWAVDYVIPFFWIEAALLAVLAPRLRFGLTGTGPKIGAVLIALAIVYPALGLIAGRPLVQVEIAGLMPDPTAIATLGLLGLAGRGWPRLALAIIPACWLLPAPQRC